MSEIRTEMILPPEQLVFVIAGLLEHGMVVSGAYIEHDVVARRAWDLYDAVFVESEERYKEGEDEEAKDGDKGADAGFDPSRQ